jgi:hypothetical protein
VHRDPTEQTHLSAELDSQHKPQLVAVPARNLRVETAEVLVAVQAAALEQVELQQPDKEMPEALVSLVTTADTHSGSVVLVVVQDQPQLQRPQQVHQLQPESVVLAQLFPGLTQLFNPTLVSVKFQVDRFTSPVVAVEVLLSMAMLEQVDSVVAVPVESFQRQVLQEQQTPVAVAVVAECTSITRPLPVVQVVQVS